MKTFEALTADSVATALAAGARPGAAFLAGGTTLVDLMALEVMAPSLVVDIKALPFTDIAETADGGMRVGALVSNAALASDERVVKRFPMLAQALLSGASPQLRNMATVGGNLLQRTRCAYFRDGRSLCNMREPGTGCAAIGGITHGHAVLGVSDACIAVHPSDMAVALVALEAVVHTVRANGTERVISSESLFVAYGEDPSRLTVLDPGELVVAVELPAVDWLAGSVYVKARTRASFEFALASAAAALEVSDGVVRQVRLALGGVATRPWRAYEAERSLVGAEPGLDAFQNAARHALSGARPQADNAYKVNLGERTVVRALIGAAAAARTPV